MEDTIEGLIKANPGILSVDVISDLSKTVVGNDKFSRAYELEIDDSSHLRTGIYLYKKKLFGKDLLWSLSYQGGFCSIKEVTEDPCMHAIYDSAALYVAQHNKGPA
ncbi:hypothetical protein JXC34_01995 [Candidatus Woesearchaeota archaeon]|nr:hypothetical protein [Candidatus Woesearchaeota archaeon]